MNDGPEPRWEEPIVRPLYVTLRRAAELLDVPYWQMHGLAFVLETRYFGEKGGAPRVLLTSIDEFIRLRDEGEDARAVLAARKDFRGWSPIRAARCGTRPRRIRAADAGGGTGTTADPADRRREWRPSVEVQPVLTRHQDTLPVRLAVEHVLVFGAH